MYKQIITEKEYRDAYENYGIQFSVGMGAEAVKNCYRLLTLRSKILKDEFKTATGQKRAQNH